MILKHIKSLLLFIEVINQLLALLTILFNTIGPRTRDKSTIY